MPSFKREKSSLDLNMLASLCATYIQVKHPSICLGAGRGSSSQTKALIVLAMRAQRVLALCRAGCGHHILGFSRKLCCVTQKKEQIICLGSSAAKCVSSDGINPSSNLEQLSFCWKGLCARDCFRHSEIKWRLLPWPFSEALETRPQRGLVDERSC